MLTKKLNVNKQDTMGFVKRVAATSDMCKCVSYLSMRLNCSSTTPIDPLDRIQLGYMTLVNTAETAYHQVRIWARNQLGSLRTYFVPRG